MTEKITIEMPKKWIGRYAAAYRAGFLAGYGDRLMKTAGLTAIIETGSSLLRDGLEKTLSAEGLAGIMQRTNERVSPFADLAKRLREGNPSGPEPVNDEEDET
jgi:hypothetical protein